MFAIGFGLASIRELWAVPRFGECIVELLEMPFMLITAYLAACWIVRRFDIPGTPLSRQLVGVVGLCLLLVAELAVVFWVRGLSVGEYIAARDPISGAAYVIALVFFAVMPSIVRRGRRHRSDIKSR